MTTVNIGSWEGWLAGDPIPFPGQSQGHGWKNRRDLDMEGVFVASQKEEIEKKWRRKKQKNKQTLSNHSTYDNQLLQIVNLSTRNWISETPNKKQKTQLAPSVSLSPESSLWWKQVLNFHGSTFQRYLLTLPLFLLVAHNMSMVPCNEDAFLIRHVPWLTT